MKIERINENQIRCTLTSFDLSVRNLNLGELAYGSEKARKLFREMIQKASNEVGFEAEDIPLMVEAIPLSNESVMLVITKVEDPEELDTRFSKFSPFNEEDSSLLGTLATELLEGTDSILDLLHELEPSQMVSADNSKNAELSESAQTFRIFTFQKLDLISEAARAVGGQFSGESTLYKKPEEGPYFLILKKPADSSDFNRICNTMAEYGAKIRHDYATESYYEEHYEVLIRSNALQILAGL
ncbi:MAG: adaptor protein MecA [Lachnospiraceae bacterium]